jgi:hypothetical protein
MHRVNASDSWPVPCSRRRNTLDPRRCIDHGRFFAHLEKSIAETWGHIDRQRHIIEVLEEHGHSQDVPTAEMMLQTLTTSLEVLCERKASMLEAMQSAGSGTNARFEWISK